MDWSFIIPHLSLYRQCWRSVGQVVIVGRGAWTPAFAGVTAWGIAIETEGSFLRKQE